MPARQPFRRSGDPIGRGVLVAVKNFLRGLGTLHQLPRLREQSEYLTREVNRLNAAQRRQIWRAPERSTLAGQTRDSFSYQWEHMPTGRALPSDPSFMAGIENHICTITRLPREWFAGKRVIDVGCGIGRYSYGFLKMHAEVTACDQSEAALRRTAELCAPFEIGRAHV